MNAGPRRVDSLTREQRERMAPFAREWIERGWRTTPLTEEEWTVQEQGMRVMSVPQKKRSGPKAS